MEESPDRMDWKAATPPQLEQQPARKPFYTHQNLAQSPDTRPHIDSVESEELGDLPDSDQQGGHQVERQFDHHHTRPRIDDFSEQQVNYHHNTQQQTNRNTQQQPDHHHTTQQVGHHHKQSPFSPSEKLYQVEPFKQGRRRTFDEFAAGEQVELNRVHQPLVTPGRVYVPPMDLRNLNPDEARALQQHVTELRQRNLEAERQQNFNAYEIRGELWQSYMLQRLVLAGAAIVLLSTAFVYGLFHAATRSGKYAYRNRHQVHQKFNLIVESTSNAAKRRLVTITTRVPDVQRARPILKHPSPRRRNGIIRQPPMTSNRLRWENEIRACEGRSTAMPGPESSVTQSSQYMMSGAIMDLEVEGSINPLYNPFYTPHPINTAALDACVRDVNDPSASEMSITKNKDERTDDDSHMSDPEELRGDQSIRQVRQSFVDFYPFRSVEEHDSRSMDRLATLGGPSSRDIAVSEDPNAVAPSPVGIYSSNFSPPDPMETPVPHSLSVGAKKYGYKFLIGTDSVHPDLLEETERELPACEFEDDPAEKMHAEISLANNEDTEPELNRNIFADVPIPPEILSTPTGTPTSIEFINLGEVVSTPNPISLNRSQELEVSPLSETTAMEIHEEEIPLSIQPIQTGSKQNSHLSAASPTEVQAEEDDFLADSLHFEAEEQRPSPSKTPIPDAGQQRSSFWSALSNMILPLTPWRTRKEQRGTQQTPSLAHEEESPSPSPRSPTQIFEPEDSPLSSDQPAISLPISSAEILEQQSSRPTTPNQIHTQHSHPLLANSLKGIPNQRKSLLSSASSNKYSPITSLPNHGQDSSQALPATPKQRAKKSVMFFESPRTGKPITKTKKYILGESINYPVSSSPAPSTASTTRSNNLEFDSPTTYEETEPFSLCLTDQKPSTPTRPHYSVTEATLEEKENFEFVNLTSQNPEPAGSWRPTVDHDEDAMLEVSESMTGSLEADNLLLGDQSSQTTTDSSLITGDKPAVEVEHPAGSRLIAAGISTDTTMTEGSSVVGPDKPVIGSGFLQMQADSSSMEAHEPPVEEERPAGGLLIRAEKSTAEDVEVAMTGGSSLIRADKPVIGNGSKKDTAGSSIGEADKPAMEEAVIAEVEAVAKVRGTALSTPLKDTPKLAKPDLSCRRSSPNRHSTQPLRKSLRLQNRNERISPTRALKLAEKLTVLDLSGGYGTTTKTSKQRKSDRKAEQARAKQAAIAAKEKAEEKARKEAKEAEEKARVAKAEAEEKARKEHEEEEEYLRKTTRRIPKEKVIQPLSAEWEVRVKRAMDTPDMRTVLVTLPSGTKLTRKDFGTLKVVEGRDPSHGWLNDEIILASLQQVVDYGLRVSGHRAGQTPKYHAFNTFFYKNLRDKGAQSIKRWATKAKIGGRALEEVERVFIPVHQGAHWTLLVVSPTARTIEYFDSMGGVADSYIRNVKLWLAAEMGSRFHEEEWAVPTGTHGVGPRQTNGSDCGVFTCTTARMVALGVDPMAYGGEDMRVQRGRMVAELLNGGLFGDFDPKVEF